MNQKPLSSLGSWPGSVREDRGDKMTRKMGGRVLQQRHWDGTTGKTKITSKSFHGTTKPKRSQRDCICSDGISYLESKR